MTGQRTALVVRGGWEGHNPVGITDLFIPFLRDNGFGVTVSDSLDSYLDADLLAAIDLIVPSWTMGEISRAQASGLRTAVENGTGFAGWHGGIADSFRSTVEYLQLVGGQFVDHPRGIRDFEVVVRDDAASHPIVEGISAFHVESEQYWVLTDSLNDVLAETTIPAEEPWDRAVTVPAVWTRQWGAGRVFVSTIGHRVSDFDGPEVRAITERGLLWASR